jgi:putative two-component system response regulator
MCVNIMKMTKEETPLRTNTAGSHEGLVRVLFVDDEKNVLYSLERAFMDSGMLVLTAGSAFEAMEILKSNEIAVIVSDNLMPGMSGIELLSRAREISPESVRIILTAHADIRSAIDAINKGEVYRFITKPWEDDEIREIVLGAVKKNLVVRSLRDADEATLLSLAQTIELKDPYTRGHCDRVARYALLIGDSMGLDAEMKRDIKYGSWLHDCGKIGVPEAVLNFEGKLDKPSLALMQNHPRWGADVAMQARLSVRIVNIILHHHERYDGLGYPSGLKGEDIPIEARIVAVADAYDAITTDRPYAKGQNEKAAIEIMESLKGKVFDPHLMDIFCGTLREWSRAWPKGRYG